jgi:hypothetical protein
MNDTVLQILTICFPQTVNKCDTSDSNHQWRQKAILVEMLSVWLCQQYPSERTGKGSSRNSMIFIHLASCTKHKSWTICQIHQSWKRGLREMRCYSAYWNISDCIVWTQQRYLCFHKSRISCPAKQISAFPWKCLVVEPHTWTHKKLVIFHFIKYYCMLSLTSFVFLVVLKAASHTNW